MPKINIDKLYLSTITKDELGIGNLIFVKPEYIPGIQSFNAKHKIDTEQNYEEGVVSDQDSTLQGVEISLDIGSFTDAQYAKYLGHHLAVTGGAYAVDGDVAPYIALLIKYTKAGGKYHGYEIFYKGKLVEPDESIKQKEGKINYQNTTVTSTFQPLKNNGLWKYKVEEDDPDCPSDIAVKFFDNVMIPTEKTGEQINPITLSSSVPVSGATGVAFDTKPVLTFNNKISSEAVLLLDADGNIVSITKSFDDTGKIMTISHNTAFAANKKYSIVISGVRDVYGQELTQSIINFTTTGA